MKWVFYLWAMVFSPFTAQSQQIFALGVQGDPAPGGNGILGPVSFFAISEGAAAFTSQTTGSSQGTTNDFILATATYQGLKIVFREGASAPGDGTFSGILGNISVNPQGAVAFYGYLSNTSMGSSNEEGIFSGTSNVVTQIVRENDPEPMGGTGVFNSFGTPVINRLGSVAFWGAIGGSGTPLINTHGIFVGNGGAVKQIARTYTSVPDGNGQYSSTSSSPVISNTGQVAFCANITGATGGAGNTGIFMGNGTSTVTIARKNDLAPNGNGRLGDFNFSVAINDNNKVAFYSNLSDTSGGSTDNAGIFVGSGGSLTKIVRTGDTAPGGNGQFDVLSNGNSINAGGDVAFAASLRNTNGGANKGLFRGNGSQIVTIARSGQTTPGGNKTFNDFNISSINKNGTVAFQAQLNSGRGIYLSDGTETIRVAEEGDSLYGSTISYLGFDPKAFNDFRNLAFQAILADGRLGAFLYSPKIKWRQNGNGQWDDASRWTVSLRPADYVAVEIDPTQGGIVDGPTSPTEIRTLQIGGTTTGNATLNLKGIGPITVSEGTQIKANGKLSGVGSLKSNLVNEAEVSPGNSPGSLNCDGNYTQTSTGRLTMEIAGTTQGAYDQFTVSGQTALAGLLTIRLLNNFESQLLSSHSFIILSCNRTLTGEFSNAANGARVNTADGAGSFQVTYSTRAVQLSNFILTDSDSDSIPDSWTHQYFNHPTGQVSDLSRAADDSDGDGMSNYSEYLAGTSPTNKTSVLQTTMTAMGPDLKIDFPTVIGRTYTVQNSNNLIDWSIWQSGIIGTGSLQTITIPNALVGTRGFYRISAKP